MLLSVFVSLAPVAVLALRFEQSPNANLRHGRPFACALLVVILAAFGYYGTQRSMLAYRLVAWMRDGFVSAATRVGGASRRAV